MGQDDGSIRRGVDPEMVAMSILAFMQGATLQWFLDPESVDLVALYDQYFDRLVEDLSPLASEHNPPKKASR